MGIGVEHTTLWMQRMDQKKFCTEIVNFHTQLLCVCVMLRILLVWKKINLSLFLWKLLFQILPSVSVLVRS